MTREKALSKSGGKLAVKLFISLLALVSLFVDAYFLNTLKSTRSITRAAPQPESAASSVTANKPSPKERFAEAVNTYPRFAEGATEYYEKLGYFRRQEENTALPTDDDALATQYGERMWMFAYNHDMWMISNNYDIISEIRAKKVGTMLELYVICNPLILGYTYSEDSYRVVSIYEGEEYVYAEGSLPRTNHTTQTKIELNADRIVENDRPVYIIISSGLSTIELDKEQIMAIAQG